MDNERSDASAKAVPAARIMPGRPLRFCAFWLLTLLITAVYALALPGLVLPRKTVLAVVKSYVWLELQLLRLIAGLRWEIIGDEAVARGPVLVAAKHQSAFETLLLQLILGDPAIVLKQELLRLPMFGWTMRRLGHIGVDRAGDAEAARKMLGAARVRHGEGRPILIFPEGSRREPGAAPDYKPGVDLLYATLKIPCVPVALNSGRLWPARSLFPGPGMITVSFLPPIAPQLPRAIFKQKLIDDIEQATEQLLAEAR
jgi:1-acyl-sn-glycerol-3-phosphate acyltransferase